MQQEDMSVGLNIIDLENGTEVEWYESQILVEGSFASFQPGMRFDKLYVVDDGILAGGLGLTYFIVEKDGYDTSIETLPRDAVRSEEYRKSAYIDGELTDSELEAAVVLSEVND